MADPRRVLIATLAVNSLYGTDLYTRDLALALLRRGWLPVVYTKIIGPPAEELRRATIPVVNDIDQVGGRPDVIHGNHALELLTAMAKFPDVPALFVCHDSLTWHSVPPPSRRIQAWAAVDRNCRDRMVYEHGVPADAVRVLLNAVDLERFKPRASLPPKPKRAVIFSNLVTENSYAPAIRAACERRGITVDLVGLGAGNPTSQPEQVLPQYDLVFGKARCALEAAAIGCAVIVCDARGLAGMMTSASVDAMRQLNFGARTLQRPITPETVGEEIDRYDPADAARVRERIRATAGIDILADQYIALYEEVAGQTVTLSPSEALEDLAQSLSHATEKMYADLSTHGSRDARLRRALMNSRILGPPMRLAWRLKKRFGL